jgi:chemotaxis protein CheC
MNDELNILREVGSIASAQGSKALSEILGRQITLNMPTTDVISYSNIPIQGKMGMVAVAIFSRLVKGLPGEIVLILNEKDAFKLITLSYTLREEDKNVGIFTECALSFVKEIGNIIIGSYIQALSSILKRDIRTSTPTLMSGTFDIILEAIFSSYSDEDFAFLIEAVFEEPQEKIKGGFFLALTQKAAADIKEVCKQILEDLEKQ